MFAESTNICPVCSAELIDPKTCDVCEWEITALDELTPHERLAYEERLTEVRIRWNAYGVFDQDEIMGVIGTNGTYSRGSDDYIEAIGGKFLLEIDSLSESEHIMEPASV